MIHSFPGGISVIPATPSLPSPYKTDAPKAPPLATPSEPGGAEGHVIDRHARMAPPATTSQSHAHHTIAQTKEKPHDKFHHATNCRSCSNKNSNSNNITSLAAIPSSDPEESWVWTQIKAESRRDAESEPALASFLYATVLSHGSLANSLSFHLANKLCSSTLLSTLLYDLFLEVLACEPSILASVAADLVAARRRDPACISYSHCLLNFKGYLAVQTHRISHALWHRDRRPMALALQSRVSDVFAVDIHPAARIGRGVLLDHATGVVVGETAVIGNNVSILHHVTLGGTGKAVGDRHPKVGDGVLIGAGATVLGNVRIGEGAKIGAGSLVLIDVPAGSTAVGNPARILQRKAPSSPVGESMDHASIIVEWSDYVI